MLGFFARPFAAALLVAMAALPVAASDFVAFESGPVRPLALSADGNTLYAVNTPANQLEIFSVDPTGVLARTATVPVGLEPVAVAVRNPGEVWVVNHLSDSVSVIDVASSPPQVRRTLLVGDEPRDVVFAGPGHGRAFITTAHRGQNIPYNPQLINEGRGRSDVWVFDAADLGTNLEGDPLVVLKLFGDTPRALAATPDGSRVYAAVFHSGNQTTTLNEQIVCNGGANNNGCVVDSLPVPGGLPAPNANVDGVPGPETGMIVKFNPSSGEWEDTLGRDWTNGVRFNLPDYDVFAIDANATPPAQVQSFSGVGTVNFNMVVNPVNGNVYVSNTEANNLMRFEGPGLLGSTVRGHLHEARITVLQQTGTVRAIRLNTLINYSVAKPSPIVKAKSLATPTDMAITSDGSTLYVAAFGSNKVGVIPTAYLDAGNMSTTQITVPGGLPGGLALHEARNRLYVLARFDNAISSIDLTTRKEKQHVRLSNPESQEFQEGRRFLYDAQLTSANGEASCSSCHVFGDLDDLAWDLGNPDDSVLVNLNPFRLGPFNDFNFHPMKGPMTTQTLRSMATHGPMHWRGDRTGATSGANCGGDPFNNGPNTNCPHSDVSDEDAAFKKFNPAFVGLIGRGTELTAEQMQSFTDFILQVKMPPNPIRNLDNSLTVDEQAGHDVYFSNTPSDTLFNCNGCHTLDPANGFFGTSGFMTFEGETQNFKVAHLRNVYTKVGMFGMPEINGINGGGTNDHRGDQIRGFGLLHDGSVDTVFRFLSGAVFTFPGSNASERNASKRQVERFVLAFDTDFKPIVGQQITLNSTNGGTVNPRIDLLIQRAAAGDCDLVVKGTVAGEARGYVREASGDFRSDRAADAPLTEVALRALATTAGQDLTFTAVPPGSGQRIGIDRDRDGALDADEVAGGTDPGSDLSLPADALTCTGGVVANKPLVRVIRNLLPSGEQALTIKADLQLTPGSLDPTMKGLRFKVLDKNGAPLIVRALGRGGQLSPVAPGWTVNKLKTRWTYVDKFASASDVSKAIVVAPAATPGLYRITINGKKGAFQIPTSALPLSLVVVGGGTEEGDAGLCGTRTFNDNLGVKPKCNASVSGSIVTCS